MPFNVKEKFQTKKNIVYNLLTFLITVIIGIWLPPFLIKRLGIEAYGLIPIAMSITSFMMLITISINGTLSRFLSIDFEDSNEAASQTMSTAFYAILVFTICLIPFIFFFSFNSHIFLDIPQNFLNNAKYLFLTVLLSFLLNAIMSLFNSVAFVKNRIDLRNLSIILNRGSLLLIIIIVFGVGFVEIEVYGYASLLAIIIALLYSYRIYKLIAPNLKLTISRFKSYKFKMMAKLGFWLTINQVGVLFFLQTDILVINKIKGAELSGVFGAISQWSFLVRSLVGIIAGVIGPIVLAYYAKKKFDELFKLTSFTTKLLGIFTSIITSVLIYFSGDILRIWLGDEFVEYKWFLILILFHLGFNLSVNSIVNINIAYNKSKIPGFVALITGLINLILGVILLVNTTLGLYAIGISGFIALTLKNFVFTPFYAAKIMGLNKWVFYKSILPSILITFLVLFMTVLLPSDILNISNNYFKLITYSLIFGIVICLLSYYFLFNSFEKKQMLSLILSRKNEI